MDTKAKRWKPGVEDRMTVLLPRKTQERVRDAAYWLRGHPANLTVADICRQAFEDVLGKLSREFNKGKPFPPRPQELRKGRPKEK
jgi:hypothetical protein